MINHKNKNYSFIAISKNSKSKKNGMKQTLHRIFSPHHSNHQAKSQEDKQDLSYVSPNGQEINHFKSKLYKYIHQNQRHQNNPIFKAQRRLSLGLNTSDTFKNLQKTYYKTTNKFNYEGIEKRKNIRQYMSQLSQDKRKYHSNKLQNTTVQLNLHAIKQQSNRKTNPLLIIRKFKRVKDQKNQKLNQTDEIFIQRDLPIHQTQIYYFSKKKTRTQYIERNNEVEDIAQTEEKRQITISRIMELREQLISRQKAKIITQNDLMKINEIHPTVAIITTRKIGNRPRSSDGNTQNIEKKQGNFNVNVSQNQKLKSRQEDEISPWKNRKNQNEFEFQ